MGFLSALLALLAGLAPSTDGAGPVAEPDCGPRIADSGGGRWRCTFSDDFTGRELDAGNWVVQRTESSGYTNGKTSCFVDDPDNVSVSGGTLRLTARTEAQPFTCQDPNGAFTTQYTSGMVSTYGRFSQAYGRFEFRARLSRAETAGLHSALWLWPADPDRYGPWPASGEIDVAEMYSAYPDRAIPFIHYNAAAPDSDLTNTGCLISNLGAFHTYTLEWTPDRMRVLYDDQLCLETDWTPAPPLTSPEPFDQPFVIVMTQALGLAVNAFNPAATRLPAVTEIDYVRAWE